jgi:hypothetical protein
MILVGEIAADGVHEGVSMESSDICRDIDISLRNEAFSPEDFGFERAGPNEWLIRRLQNDPFRHEKILLVFFVIRGEWLATKNVNRQMVSESDPLELEARFKGRIPSHEFAQALLQELGVVSSDS